MLYHFVPFAFLAAVLACDENDHSVTGPPHTHPGIAVTSIPLSGGPWGVGMSSRGSVFVTQAAATFVTRVAVDSDTVAQSYAVGSGPYDASFNAAETKLYVTTLYDGMVRALNPATGTVIDSISAPPEPVRVLLGRGETKLYVTQADGRLQVFNPTTHALDTTLTLGGVPLNDIALSRSGTRLYVSSVGGTVTEVNTSTDAVTRSYTPGGKPQDLIVSPGDSILYVANEGGWVEVWNIMAWTRRDSIPVPGAFGLTLTPDGSQLWVTATSTGQVIVIDCATRTVKKLVPVLGAPRHIVITPDGSTAVVANEAGYVQIIR
jgi:YVTN family beta-propeller protein